MNKTASIWLLAMLCSIIVFTALGVVTYTLVQQDTEQVRNFTDAYKQERIRMSMWRLDSLAASMVNTENERSIYEFKNPEFQSLPKSLNAPKVNGLYFSQPTSTKLYFNLTPTKNSKVISPQVYNTQYLEKNDTSLLGNSFNTEKLQQLNSLLDTPIKKTEDTPPFCEDNRAFACLAAHTSLNNWQVNQAQTVEQTQDFSYSKALLSRQEIVNQVAKPAAQKQLSIADRDSRKKAINRIATTKKKSSWGAAQESQQLDKTGVTPAPVPAQAKNYYPELGEPFSTPFLPIWLNQELVLVRKVTEPGGDSVQGIWVDFESLQQLLLDEIKDLFPNATFIPIKQDISKILTNQPLEDQAEITLMANLPLKLIPNEIVTISIDPKKYIFGPIGLAWLGAICAMLASYFMLKAVLNMSEKRASFVSSVTHELRTPLTTFRLYSDLLSSGMIKDAEKQQNYLDTLKHEADRLTHIVENVLSYSSIEKGSARAKIEDVTITNLIERMQPRLAERGTEEDMLININLDSESALQTVQVDSTAVEQIIFNLVDNACKYATVEGVDKQIDIVITTRRKQLVIEVRDQGMGIDPRESKRLFKPFHKSAKQAADTKPGVGLGLALCRRLARAMKGDLKIINSANTTGACFQLTLPIKRS